MTNFSGTGRPHEVLQREYLAKWNTTPIADQEKIAPPVPETPQEAAIAPPPIPVKEEPKLSVEDYDKSGKLPLAALPLTDLRILAASYACPDASKLTRDKVIQFLNEKGITEAAVSK